MKTYLIALSFAGLAACGGTSIDMAPNGGLSPGQGVVSTGSRNANGRPVTYDRRLDAAAQAHADDLVDRGYFSHKSPESNDVEDRI